MDITRSYGVIFKPRLFCGVFAGTSGIRSVTEIWRR